MRGRSKGREIKETCVTGIEDLTRKKVWETLFVLDVRNFIIIAKEFTDSFN